MKTIITNKQRDNILIAMGESTGFSKEEIEKLSETEKENLFIRISGGDFKFNYLEVQLFACIYYQKRLSEDTRNINEIFDEWVEERKK